MKRLSFFRVLPVVLAVILILALAACEDEAAVQEGSVDTPQQSEISAVSGQRGYRVQPRGNGEDTVTLMLYLCGSDLESEGAAATIDLIEIAEAEISENLNIIVETGGSKMWHIDSINPNTNQRWEVRDSDLHFLEDVGLRDMSEADTLFDFISYSASNFPADRYMLVLWDHGGGTVDGYAYDERFGGHDMMPISELNRALRNSGVVFDMIGFDCCLMSTAETAFMVEKYADYMVASQRIEPGDGWFYTPWITALSRNTSIPTPELGKIIVDSFIAESRSGYYGNELTLSVLDLTHIPELFESLYRFFEYAQDGLMYDNAFIAASQTLGTSRAMTDNYDLVDMALLLGSMEGSGEVLALLERCVVYNGTTIDDHNGLCLYFPYTDLGKVSQALDIYRQIGINESYRSFITAFANVMVGGQVYSSGGMDNPMGGDGFDLDYWLGLEWVDELLLELWDAFFEENCYDGSELEIYEKDGGYVLSLSEGDWDLVTSVLLRVFLDDGEGYIDLGSDAMYEFDGDGDLLIEFDNTWVALDGELVTFYTLEEVYEGGFWYTYGVVPVLYEGSEAEIVLMWDDDDPYGFVAGWRYTSTGSGSQRGLFELHDGMTFHILCDYYTYNGDYDDQYLWGSITIDGPVIVSYEDVGDADCLVYYELYDIYRNTWWTEAVIYSIY